jgi:hypothetical protein
LEDHDVGHRIIWKCVQGRHCEPGGRYARHAERQEPKLLVAGGRQ